MFLQRLVSALLVMPVVLGAAWLGGPAFLALLLGVGFLALLELYRITRLESSMLRWAGLCSHAALLACSYFTGYQYLLFALLAFFLLINILWIFTYPQDFRALTVLIWGAVYITVSMSAFIWLRQEGGFIHVLAVLVAVWASDSGAYYTGRTLGRRKLIPAVSPQKSVEGACGGVLFAVLAMGAMSAGLNITPFTALLFGAVLSVMGQLGDLAESALKRWAHLKDSGSFLPGHGGVLDRLDSLLFAAPVAYIFFIVVTLRG